MKKAIVNYMIDNNFIKTNSLINATIQVNGLGGQPVILAKDTLYEDCGMSPRGGLYLKVCAPDTLHTHIVGVSKVHQINGMDESTVTRLFPEMNL